MTKSPRDSDKGPLTRLAILLQPRRFTLNGQTVSLRSPRRSDYPQWREVRLASRGFLEQWEPLWPGDPLDKSLFLARLRTYRREKRLRLSCHFFIFKRRSHNLIGGLTIYDIQYGASQSASLGYWIGLPFRRKGYVFDALRTVIPFIFNNLQIHRLNAACLPENEPSRKLLLKCGFSQEGRVRDYMQIAGRPRDHILFSLLAGDPRP